METAVRTPMDIFHLPQRLIVPLFQRQYVWDEAEQWLPLWQDVRRVAELRLKDPGNAAAHFLGAVVLQAQDGVSGALTARNIIDGQQRLTTLQLLMDAAAAVIDEAGEDTLAAQLDLLTHNPEMFAGGGGRLKLLHTNRDGLAYTEVMDAEPPIDYRSLHHSGSLLTRAHQFFVGVVSAWLGEPSQAEEFAQRAQALIAVLLRGLQLVVIDLQAHENSQEIFETLNARGTPLTASDLIKNFVFQQLEIEGVDVRRAYAEDWPFDAPFWDEEVSVGRYSVGRGSLFLNQWLTSRLGEEVSPKSTFSRFRHHVEHEADDKVSDLLATIKRQADLYESWTRAAGDPDRGLDSTELAVYRMHESGMELLKPILIWLHEPALLIPAEVADAVIAITESWVTRRQLLRLSSADLGRVVADIVRLHRDLPASELPPKITDYLTGLTAPSVYWPGDEEIRAALATENAYHGYHPRTRLRMFLEAIEDSLRATHNQPRVPRRRYPIEHVMPQRWQAHWNVDGPQAQQERATHIHRLGNLTLTTESLNSAASNGPWQGANGKRARLAAYDVFLLNRAFHNGAVWDEAAIDDRTAWMVDALLATWPVPVGHAGASADPSAADRVWIEVRHLVAAGLLSAGTRLTSRPGKWTPTVAVVTAEGLLEIGGLLFQTPSGAGRQVKGAPTNGWYFWLLDDGRRLADVRAVYRGEQPAVAETTDWTRLHRVLEALPEGGWTTLDDLADLVSVAAPALGEHLAACGYCTSLLADHHTRVW